MRFSVVACHADVKPAQVYFQHNGTLLGVFMYFQSVLKCSTANIVLIQKVLKRSLKAMIFLQKALDLLTDLLDSMNVHVFQYI